MEDGKNVSSEIFFLIWFWDQQNKCAETSNLLHLFCHPFKLLRPSIHWSITQPLFLWPSEEPWPKFATQIKLVFLTWSITYPPTAVYLSLCVLSVSKSVYFLPSLPLMKWKNLVWPKKTVSLSLLLSVWGQGGGYVLERAWQQCTALGSW